MSNHALTYAGRCVTPILLLAVVLLTAPNTPAQENVSAKSKAIYDQIKAFSLTGGSVTVEALTMKRDRAEITFDGTFYFSSPVEGRVTGAVFIGQGKFRAEPPPSEFEKENVRRMLGADIFESDFKTAVLRFTDDTFDIIGRNRREGDASTGGAQKLALEADVRMLKQTGANLSARLALSLLNNEAPGFFFATFDGGKRDRFNFLLDHQNRIPVANFDLNGGEKGMIFSYRSPLYGNDVWMAFYALEDYLRRVVDYSDINDLIDITHYQMDVNLRDHKDKLRLATRLKADVRFPLRALSFQLGEALGESEDRRLKKQMRLKSARSGGAEVVAVQEDWEGGLTLFLSRPAQAGQKLDLEIELEGDFLYNTPTVTDCYYPLSNTSWFPRHGYLDRATFDLSFVHRKKYRIASVGQRLSEEPSPDDKELVITKYRMQHPVALVTFAIGPFERHKQMVKWDKGGEPIPVEFNSLSGSVRAIKEDFILAELDNSLRYFTVLFGQYPYPIFSAAFHPFGFGQGFPSLVMMPDTDRASKYTYAFVAHETAHQWWGNIVAWRSYRDQWLSEGFAEYSGILYTGLRESSKASAELIRELRRSLKDPPVTLVGVGDGKLADVGPIILGHRLNTSKTFGAYQALIYNKGALVLRMLHFLMSNPSTGDDRAFYEMMTAFVERHRNGFASTDDFRVIANEHFAKTPIAQKHKLADLNWFFNQWVYQSGLPSYQMEYQMMEQADGSIIISGTVTQENVPAGWFMPLPLVFSFGGDQQARGTIHAYGPKTPFQIKLPMKPKKVELDPHNWVLSEKTSTKGK
jgi:hypothetical protein